MSNIKVRLFNRRPIRRIHIDTLLPDKRTQVTHASARRRQIPESARDLLDAIRDPRAPLATDVQRHRQQLHARSPRLGHHKRHLRAHSNGLQAAPRTRQLHHQLRPRSREALRRGRRREPKKKPFKSQILNPNHLLSFVFYFLP